ncbi:MAG: ABC transporter permease subunit [Acidobacteria bacterium]|nr:ABC transporter permease subunit [Acidobacteriota bacterium]
MIAITATVLLGGLVSAVLVRISPGFAIDENQLDPRLNAESLRALRASHSSEANILRFYAGYMNRAVHGDLGISHSLGQPVGRLLRDRVPVTGRLAAGGLALAWTFAFGLAAALAAVRISTCDVLAIVLSGILLCLPAAVMALLSVLWNAPASLAVALIVFPRVFTYSRNLLLNSYSLPHIVTARAKGLSKLRTLFWHVLPSCAPSLVAVGGISVNIALSAAIPVEALCGVAGVGSLAWQAAMARDLPLLVNVTVLVTLVTLLSDAGADVIGYVLSTREN